MHFPLTSDPKQVLIDGQWREGRGARDVRPHTQKAAGSACSDKNDCTWYQPVFDVPNDPMVMEFNDFMWELNKEKLTPKQFQRELYKFKNFASAFGIDYSRPFSWEDDLPGKEGWVILGVKKSDEYGDQNSVSKYVVKK